MADSFFGFTTDVPTSGLCNNMDLLSSEVKEEDEYDALNNETFGAGVMDDDWEEGHEKFAELDYENLPQIKSDLYGTGRAGTFYGGVNRQSSYLDDSNDKDIEQSISQLVLDDDVGDSAIVGLSRAKPTNISNRAMGSPPPPAIVESDHVGSPATNSIWSTTTKVESFFKPKSGNVEVSAFLNALKGPNASFSDLQYEDPSIVGISKDLGLVTNSSSAGPKLIPNVKTLEEIEHDLLLDLHHGKSNVVSQSRLHDEVERDILLKPRVRTVSEIEREMSRSPVNSTRVFGPPPGLTNGGTKPPATRMSDQSGSYHIIHPGLNSVTSPLTIHGGIRRPINAGMSPSPPISSPSPPLLFSMSPHSPPAFRVPSSYASGAAAVRVHTFPNRMIPPQLTAYQRHPYLNRVPTGHQAILLSQLHYPPAMVGPGGRVLPFGPNHSRMPVGFTDPRQVRRFTHSGQPLVQQQQQQQNIHMRQQLQQKRNSWSEPGTISVHGHPLHYNNYNNGQSNDGYTCDVDEYANLMTQSEKDWIVKIQLMQLQTDNPYMDDYYYTTFTLKKRMYQTNKAEEPKLVIPKRSKAELRTYQPAQFEGSLGRLQVMSVNCPRKMIDLGIEHPDDGDAESQKVPSGELKRIRQLLMEIEKLYTIYLETDDLDKKAAALPEDARVPLYENRDHIIGRIHVGLVSGGSDHFAQIMSIRKGRNFVSRSLSLFSDEQVDKIVNLVLSNLAIILRKDHIDPVMPRIWAFGRQLLNSCKFKRIIELGLRLLNQSADITVETPPTPHFTFISVLSNEAGLRIVADLTQRAEELITAEENSDLHNLWSAIVRHVANTLCNVADASLSNLDVRFSHFDGHLRRFDFDESELNLELVRHKIMLIDNGES